MLHSVNILHNYSSIQITLNSIFYEIDLQNTKTPIYKKFRYIITSIAKLYFIEYRN